MTAAELQEYHQKWLVAKEEVSPLIDAPEPDEESEPRPYRLKDGTLPYLLYHVARALSQPFSIEELTLAAWRTHPGTFGMRTAVHPDTNRVVSVVVGQRGLVARGLLERVGPHRYRVV